MNRRHFPAGHTPWNKGRKGYQAGGRSLGTRFKLGNRPQTWRQIGSERVVKDDILQRKVTDTGAHSDWIPVHVLVWEAAHGPVPARSVIVFSDRNRRNFALANLECLTRAEVMCRNHGRLTAEQKSVAQVFAQNRRRAKSDPEPLNIARHETLGRFAQVIVAAARPRLVRGWASMEEAA